MKYRIAVEKLQPFSHGLKPKRVVGTRGFGEEIRNFLTALLPLDQATLSSYHLKAIQGVMAFQR